MLHLSFPSEQVTQRSNAELNYQAELTEDVPFVYDVHRHRCLPEGMEVAEVTESAHRTWDRGWICPTGSSYSPMGIRFDL